MVVAQTMTTVTPRIPATLRKRGGRNLRKPRGRRRGRHLRPASKGCSRVHEWFGNNEILDPPAQHHQIETQEATVVQVAVAQRGTSSSHCQTLVVGLVGAAFDKAYGSLDELGRMMRSMVEGLAELEHLREDKKRLEHSLDHKQQLKKRLDDLKAVEKEHEVALKERDQSVINYSGVEKELGNAKDKLDFLEAQLALANDATLRANGSVSKLKVRSRLCRARAQLGARSGRT